MDTYRQLQAEKWRSKNPQVPAPPEAWCDDSISIAAIDGTSLECIRSFIRDTDGSIPRSGILFGTIAEDGFTVIIDAIYEWAQDTITGQSLRDARLPMFLRLTKLMGLKPVGILIAKASPSLTARDLLQLMSLRDASAHVIVHVSTIGPEFHARAVVATEDLGKHARTGTLRAGTSLSGKTVNGGLDGTALQREVPLVTRTVNDVIHNGFHRLNRPNHLPTLNDARAFIALRATTIPELHLQVADFHLLLFFADALDEASVERMILAIFQKEDELIETLLEVIMAG